MTDPALSAEQRAIVDRIEKSDDHVFVTGRAGTGKSTLLRYLAEHTQKQVAICAPTGVAALNVGGQTIHSLLRLPIGIIAQQELKQNEPVRRVLRAIDTLVIDEVSMVSADLMDGIDRALRQARGRSAQPFGGVQVVMFGDPYQLAPVPARGDEAAYLRDRYRSDWFFDARVWAGNDDGLAGLGPMGAVLNVYELTHIHRQSDDRFKTLLNAVRHGRVTADMAQVLNDAGRRTPPEPRAGETPIITLATRNDRVAAINRRHLDALDGRAQTARAEVTGDFGRGENSYPADLELQLKIGAQVMFLRNAVARADDTVPWVNGTIGTVTRIQGETVRVDVDGEEHDVEPAVWEKFRYSYSPLTGNLTREVVAEFHQFPLRLAWAVTIHKAQGQTHDRAIIDLGAGAFAPGQTYVALSRLRGIDGLYMTRDLRPRDILVDPDVRRFLG